MVSFRASTIDILNLEVLNGSHMNTSFFYNFLIIVYHLHFNKSNKNNSAMIILLKSDVWST